MINIKDHKQQLLFDPWAFLSAKRRQMLDTGWPGLFREHLLEEMPVELMVPFFHQGFGRPTKELHTVLGVMLFQQTMDLNDVEAIDQLMYNIQWHYALNITEESDEAKTISEKTLWSMRQIVTENNLDEVMFERISDKLAKVFEVDTTHQRIDSVHIRSNMRKLGRITIFSQTIKKFLVNLKRHHRDLFDEIDQDLIERYWTTKSQSVFSMVKARARTDNRGFNMHAYRVFRTFKELIKVNTRNLSSIFRIHCDSIFQPDSSPENFKLAA